jgi:hypothetical protein
MRFLEHYHSMLRRSFFITTAMCKHRKGS